MDKENVFASPNKYRIKEQQLPYKYNHYFDEEDHTLNEIKLANETFEANHISPEKQNKLRDSQLNDMISYSLAKPSKVNLGDQLNPHENGNTPIGNVKVQNFNPVNESEKYNEKLGDYDEKKSLAEAKNTSATKIDSEAKNREECNKSRASKKSIDEMREIQLFSVGMHTPNAPNLCKESSSLARKGTNTISSKSPLQPMQGAFDIDKTSAACYFNSSIFKLSSDSIKAKPTIQNKLPSLKSHSNSKPRYQNDDIEILDGTINANALDDQSKDAQIENQESMSQQNPTDKTHKLKNREIELEKVTKRPPKGKHKGKKKKKHIKEEFDINEQKRIINRYIEIAKHQHLEKDLVELEELMDTIQEGILLPPSKIIAFRYLEMINSPYVQPISIPAAVESKAVVIQESKKRHPSNKELTKLSEIEKLYSIGGHRSSSSDSKITKLISAMRASTVEAKTDRFVGKLKMLSHGPDAMAGSLKNSMHNKEDAVISVINNDENEIQEV